MLRDVILSCFATPNGPTWYSIKEGLKGSSQSNGADYFQDPTGFKSPPLVVNVPFVQGPDEQNVSPAFERQALSWKKKYGSIIKGALSELAPGVQARTVSILTFSGGQAFAKAVMQAGEGQFVDGVYMLDGLHLTAANSGNRLDGFKEEWGSWVDFARQAVLGQRSLVLFHTAIELPHKSALNTTESATVITDKVREMPELSAAPKDFLNLVTPAVQTAAPPPKVTIYSENGSPPNVSWDAFPFKSTNVHGNYVDFNMGGYSPNAHIFAATYGLRFVWQNFYRTRMNQDSVLCSTSGWPLGAAEPAALCRRNLNTLPADMQAGPVIADELSFLSRVGLVALGAAGGWYLAKRIWR